MARGKKDTTRRGSPEAIAKRRAARSLNTLFAKGASTGSMDGRTLKRKNRLMQELQEGKGGSTIKAHEVLSHVTELLALGESLTTIRALKPRLPPALPVTDANASIIKETQASYNFDPRAWKFLGVDIDAVLSGEKPAAAKSTTKKAARKKKS
jgi:hypothetical protein